MEKVQRFNNQEDMAEYVPGDFHEWSSFWMRAVPKAAGPQMKLKVTRDPLQKM